MVTKYTDIVAAIAGTGLTSSGNLINIQVVKGVTFSNGALFSDAGTILTTAVLPTSNIATGSTIQSALTAIDNQLTNINTRFETSVNSSPTGTFLSSITTPVQINSGVTFSTLSYGDVEVFVNGIYVQPQGTSASAFFFSTNGVAASAQVTIGTSLWSNVNALGFNLDVTDNIIVRYLI